MRARHCLALGSAIAAGSTVASAAPSLAVPPVVTVNRLDPGPGITSPTYTFSGNFRSDGAIKHIRVVLCRVPAPGSQVCTDYLTSTGGTYGSAWTALGATITTGDLRSGTYRLPVSGLRSGHYLLAAYAADSTTEKGPRAYLSFTANVAPTTGQRFVTILWGKSMWQPAADPGCTDTNGSRTLGQNAVDLRSRGLFGVGGVVVNRTPERGLTCFVGGTAASLQPSWTELARLRDLFGWRFISQGMNYTDMTTLKTDAERFAESAATLPAFVAHGHTRAWGAFNYPNNRQDLPAQRVVTKSFAFGREYSGGVNTRTSVSIFPYAMSTNSVNGGRCNNPRLPCYTMPVDANRRTTSIDELRQVLHPATQGWGVVQYYRIVERSRGRIGDTFAWNCSPKDWRDRWTSLPELTCRESLLEALDGRDRGATPADPSMVAEAWNLRPWGR